MLGVTRKWFLTSPCLNCCRMSVSKYLSQNLENKYSGSQKNKILQIINESDFETLSRYDVAKVRLKKLKEWVNRNGKLKNISDIETVEGLTGKTVIKFYNSIIEGPIDKISNKLKGQILHPTLPNAVKQNCRFVVSVYVTVNSVCWTLIDRNQYELLEWKYHSIEYPEGKKFHITNILDIAWNVVQKLPNADIYVMKGEATSLRAGGSDPNNPKMLAVNLQKAQLVSMIIALINARSNIYNTNSSLNEENSNEDLQALKQNVYFLRPTLPYRLHGTLVGNEKVSTDQTVQMLLDGAKEMSSNKSHVYVSERLVGMFRSENDFQRDMLGNCLLLAITFMDVCIYNNQKSIDKLAKRGD